MAKIDDARLAALLEAGIGRSVGFSGSRLSKEREEVQKYMSGEKPYRSHSGDTKYNSFDVWTETESMKAVLLELFSGNSRPVTFNATGPDDASASVVRTDYVTSVLFDENKGFSIFQTVIEDGLTNRAGIVKVLWEEKHLTEHYELSDTTYSELTGFLAKNPDAEIKEIVGHQDGVNFKRVKLAVKKDRSQVRIMPLPPEQFGISPMASDIETADLVFHKEPRTVSELIKAGYSKATIMDLQENDSLWLTAESDTLQRFSATDDMVGLRGEETGMKSNRQILVYECYLELASDDEDGTAQLTKVVMAGDQILSREPVDRKPFVAFVPLPKPHAFWGSNFAHMLIPTQNARTYLTRGILNHVAVTNNPRMMVAKGGLLSPRELTENRFGGIVNVKSLESVAPLPQASLNPYVFQVRQVLGEDKEQITGSSSLSQGLNKDAISKQNSQEMVQDLITVGQTRQRIIGRNFAENFLRPLYTMIYRLVLENESRQKIIQVAGSWTPVDVTEWPEDCEMSVAFALGLNENKAEAEKWTKMDAYFSKDPGLSHAYPPEKRFAVVKKAMEAMGIRNVTDYLLTPDQITPPQPSPMDLAHLGVLQADAKVKLANATAAAINSQIAQKESDAKAQEALAKIQLQTTKATGDLQIKQDALAHKVAVDAAEIALEQQALASGGGKLTAIASSTR